LSWSDCRNPGSTVGSGSDAGRAVIAAGNAAGVERKLAMSLAPAPADRLQRRCFAMHTTSKLSVHDPDGVPHVIVGLTWLVVLAVAICSFAALTVGGVVTALALVFVPAVIIALGLRAERSRGVSSR
jgi:hypothetical protein